MENNDKKIQRHLPPLKSAQIVEKIYGCKWSLTVFHLLKHDICRPGEMVRAVDGLSTKVLNDCLRKNVDFGILEKKTYPEVPPRVEYHLTDFGVQFMPILDALETLQDKIPEGKG